MARRDKYHINYEKLYPGIEIPPEVLSVLRKGDRKEEYQEVDLKQERFVYDPETKTAHFIPGREDSYERLVEDEKRQFSNEDPTPEEHLMRSIENELLRQAVALLKEDERQLILLRFWQECSQSQVAELLGLSQQAVSYRERNILNSVYTSDMV